MGRFLSQSGIDFHHCYMVGGQVWLPRGNVTYHLGLLALAEGLAKKEKAVDLLDGLEELLFGTHQAVERGRRECSRNEQPLSCGFRACFPRKTGILLIECVG